MTIEESNRIIAEFDGFILKRIRYYHPNRPSLGFLHPNQFMYELSWGWLMPVVEKIESVTIPWEDTFDDKPAFFSVHIFKHCCDIQIENSGESHIIEITAFPSKISAVYAAVVQFIQWYNSNTTTHANRKESGY